MDKAKLRQELKYTVEGLKHIEEAYNEGEYADTLKYLGDVKAQETSIARIERQIERAEA